MPDMATLPNGAIVDEVVLPISLPAPCAANAVFDARYFSDVEFQFTTGTVTVTRSLDGTNYVSWPVYDSSGSLAASAGAAGIWSTDGGGFLKFNANVTVRGGN